MGELWQIGDAPAEAEPRVRKRTLRRWAIPVAAALVLTASLATVVRRGEEGRRLSERAAELEAGAEILSDRLLGERVRIDSLTTLSRLSEAASTIGLRQAAEGELIRLRESGSADGADGAMVAEGGQ